MTEASVLPLLMGNDVPGVSDIEREYIHIYIYIYIYRERGRERETKRQRQRQRQKQRQRDRDREIERWRETDKVWRHSKYSTLKIRAKYVI